MKKFLSGVYGYLILIIVAGVTLFFLFSNLTKKSFYPETGNFKVKGISKTVNVFKDDFGVSHVSAENEADMYFTMGYMHAAPRATTMCANTTRL